MSLRRALTMLTGFAAASCADASVVKDDPILTGGRQAAFVRSVIKAVDRKDIGFLKEHLVNVTFTEGEIGHVPVTRSIRFSDIPGSEIQGRCHLDSVVGDDAVVRAHWDCDIKDVLLDRTFIFKSGKLTNVENIYAVLG